MLAFVQLLYSKIKVAIQKWIRTAIEIGQKVATFLMHHLHNQERKYLRRKYEHHACVKCLPSALLPAHEEF